MKYNIVMILLFLAGCTASIVYSSEGEELYYEKCGGCHRVYPKDEIKSLKMKFDFDVMSRKSKLNEIQKKMIMEYLEDNPEKSTDILSR